MENKRKYKRVYLKTDVLYDNGRSAYSMNISEDGLCLVTDKPMEKSEETTLLFHLTNNERRFIKTTGKIMWNRELTTGEHESGVQFKYMEELYKVKIHHFVGSFR
ncbi:MAG: PilZ domain-containing protein [Spirochaetales bacterium]|nr:PilZ domain-containing protein [Spirochaetales bacterium]